MAIQEANPETTPSAQVVGNAFVEQYYHILHQSPNLVHRFYQDSSILSRSDSNGVMTTVTTTKDINEKIISLNYEDYTAEIKTADAQESYEKGVIVLVTGCLTGKDNVRRKFSQTFFLAPQDKGYYVLNDVFRYIEENDTLQLNSTSINVINENAEAVHMPESEDVHAPEHLVADTAASVEGENLNNGAEVYDPQDEEEGSVIDEEVTEPPTDLSQNDIVTIHDSTSAVQDYAPRTSYASIVMKSNTASSHVYVPSRAARVGSAQSTEQWSTTAKSTPVPEALGPSSDSAPGSSDVHEEAEGHSIYIRNLPFNATVEQLEEVFQKFGPIKHGGIQVRSSKHGFCFGFVEFEELSSMHSALEASPITVGERQAVVEEKRTTTRVSGSGRGRYPSGRGGFRSESFRGRGKFGGGRGFGRNEFRNQGEFSGRPRSSQRSNQNGGGRGGRQGAGNRSSTQSTAA
ncbi:ras GTPase-activating protein-binding protein 1 [Abrus precatorius]|uniref:Ras GTPase-activating protein-binding protein 1 n=1 Tax=Abrus precatorius TaxID=3816 RepID=A0A8B8JF44_ABRPR|nr:ras GTPase-activating protein-binding protein 1 [Abrus precatorius]XP_027329488.1 ras GTPase-activating protein-binding protein 1 [Abrus precatorius]XP_027329489.1 ras GTPase-activating protein-binding protein 1 [Abrus precatorius]XP_027329490.1 ras GTPase-activating protein-binding protein 1 [Abrus precatorius]